MGLQQGVGHLSGSLFCRPTIEFLRAAIPVPHAVVSITDDDRIEAEIKEPRFSLGAFLGAFAFGYVDIGSNPALRVA